MLKLIPDVFSLIREIYELWVREAYSYECVCHNDISSFTMIFETFSFALFGNHIERCKILHNGGVRQISFPCCSILQTDHNIPFYELFCHSLVLLANLCAKMKIKTRKFFSDYMYKYVERKTYLDLTWLRVCTLLSWLSSETWPDCLWIKCR